MYFKNYIKYSISILMSLILAIAGSFVGNFVDLSIVSIIVISSMLFSCLFYFVCLDKVDIFRCFLFYIVSFSLSFCVSVLLKEGIYNFMPNLLIATTIIVIIFLNLFPILNKSNINSKKIYIISSISMGFVIASIFNVINIFSGIGCILVSIYIINRILESVNSLTKEKMKIFNILQVTIHIHQYIYTIGSKKEKVFSKFLDEHPIINGILEILGTIFG